GYLRPRSWERLPHCHPRQDRARLPAEASAGTRQSTCPSGRGGKKMRAHKSTFLGLAAAVALAVAMPGAMPGAKAADAPSFTLKYGVLAGLTGEPAADAQAWNEAAKLGIEHIAAALQKLGLSSLKVQLVDSQDSQGSPQPGVEGAQKLVQIDGVNVIIGDFYSSVTSAVATAVTIPNKVLIFTGGTSPALSKLNTGSPAFVWQPVAADDVQ